MMNYWTDEGHLTDLALQLRTSGELEPTERRAANDHLGRCEMCRGAEAEWMSLFHRLEALPTLEPRPGFEDAVMARVHVPALTAARAPGWAPTLLRRTRQLVVGTAALWCAALAGGVTWFLVGSNASVSELAAGIVNYGAGLLWAAVIRVGAVLELSGLTRLLGGLKDAIPGYGVLGGIALMTAVSGLALWMLYRLIEYKPVMVRTNAHV